MTLAAFPVSASSSALQWRELPSLPRPLGGQFAGAAGKHLLVAGGSYFNTPPWDGGRKQFVDTIFAFGPGDSHWREAGRLPVATASGAAASVPAGTVLIGGQTATGYTARCHLLALDGGRVRIERLPDLPRAAALLSAAGTGHIVYAAGGQETPSSTAALDSLWKLELNSGKWEQVATLPEAGRILPVLVATDQDLFLISGAALTGTLGPPLGRRFLADAYVLASHSHWKPVAPPPAAVQAAGAAFWNRRLVVFGGNDGSAADREFELRDQHPGFSRAVLAYDPRTDRWAEIGRMPVSLVTSGAVPFGDEMVIPGGEDRPAHRSDRVLAAKWQAGPPSS